MLKKAVVVIAILTASLICFGFNVRVVTGGSYNKLVNGDAGIEMLMKSTIGLTDGLDLKFGASQGYTAHRANSLAMNHGGVRVDIGVIWKIGDFGIGYTHSERSWNSEASPRSVFLYDSVDKIEVRKEFNFKI